MAEEVKTDVLSLERQLRHRAFCDDLERLSLAQLKEIAAMCHLQMLQQDTRYQTLLKQKWGLDGLDNPRATG